MSEVQVDYRVVEIIADIDALLADNASPVTTAFGDGSHELQKIVDHIAAVVDAGELEVTFPQEEVEGG